MTVKKSKHDASEQQAEFSIIPHEKLMALYASLLKSAAARRGATARGGKHDDWPAVEAAAPAVCLDLHSDDLVIIGAKSEPLRIAAGLEKPLGPVKGTAAAERLPELIGKALAFKTQTSARIGVAFWREPNEPAWLDAMELARAHGLPIVFVCPPLSEASIKQVGSFATAPGTELPRITVDGHDPVAVYRVAYESIQRARRRRGATLIECGHFRVPGLRVPSDPVASMERYLRGKGLFKPALKRELTEKAAAELRAR